MKITLSNSYTVKSNDMLYNVNHTGRRPVVRAYVAQGEVQTVHGRQALAARPEGGLSTFILDENFLNGETPSALYTTREEALADIEANY